MSGLAICVDGQTEFPAGAKRVFYDYCCTDLSASVTALTFLLSQFKRIVGTYDPLGA